jgi:hypothetical protein
LKTARECFAESQLAVGVCWTAAGRREGWPFDRRGRRLFSKAGETASTCCSTAARRIR